MLRIDRIFEGGNRIFMSEFEIMPSTALKDEPALWNEFEKLGSMLGKSICIDNPELRRVMGIDAGHMRDASE